MKNSIIPIQSRAPLQKQSLKTNKFRFLDADDASSVPNKYTTYKPPRIVKGKRWYIEFYYYVPESLRAENGNVRWKRFRVFEDINRYKTMDYAKRLRQAIENVLEKGYNPLIEPEPELKIADWSLNAGLDKFCLYCEEKGLRKKTVQSYKITVNFLKSYFLKGNKIYQPVTSFTKDDIKTFLSDMRKKQKWGNYTFNNYLTSLRTIFNWFVREEKIEKSPVAGIEELSVNITSHRYYDNKTAAALKKAMTASDPYLHKFCEFIYYTGTRPKSEARLLQVKHVLFDRGLLFVPAQVSKNKKDDYIPLGKEAIELLHSVIDGKPGDYYIFGKHGSEPEPASQNYFASRYKPFKDMLGLGEEYTIYSWKATRAIHLANDGVSPYSLMQLFRHSSLTITMAYLRCLGLSIDDSVKEKTRKF